MKTLFGSLLVSITFCASPLFAAPKAKGLRIKTYSVNKKQVLVEFGSDQIIRRGMILTAGKGCKLKVASIKNSKAIATTKHCPKRRLIKKGKIVKVYDYRTRRIKKKKPVVKRSRMKTPKKVVKAPSTAVMDGLEVSMFFSAVDTIDIEGSKNVGSLDSGPSFGATLRYGHIPNNGVGFLGGINLGWGMFLNRVTLKDKTQAVQAENTNVLLEEDQGDFMYVLPEFNAALGLFKAVYLYGGPNYSIPIKKALPSVNFQGDVGFQAGLGVNVVKNFSLELGHRWINYKVSSDKETGAVGDVDIARQWGLFARAGLLF